MLSEALLTLITGVLYTINSLLPHLDLSQEFLLNFSTGTDMVISFFTGAGYFIPLDDLANCITVVLVVDNWSSIMRLFKWVMNLVRGGL